MSNFSDADPVELIDAFVQADLDEKRRLIEAHGDLLLSEKVIEFFRAQAAACEEGSDDQRFWGAHIALIEACRKRGILALFDSPAESRLKSLPPRSAEELQELIDWIFAAQTDPSVSQHLLAFQVERALFALDRADNPQIWAALKGIRGNALRYLGDNGDLAALHEAEGTFCAALQEFTRQRYPLHWASTQNNIGTVQLSIGRNFDRRALLRAVESFNLALEVRSREGTPFDWAATQSNLSMALCMLGHRGDDGARARSLEACKLALAVFTRDHTPCDWAGAQLNLGNVLSSFGHFGDDAAAIGAIEAYEQALQVFTCQQTPHEWALSQNNLGNALLTLVSRGDEAALFRAISSFELALQVWTREHAPLDWAMAHCNLGRALIALGQRGHETALVRAIDAYSLALTVRTRERAPLAWASTLSELSIALLTQGVRGIDSALDGAIAACKLALEEVTPERVPLEWAATQQNLGNALLEKGLRAGGAEVAEAIQAYRAALTVRTRKNTPLDWARTQNGLGNALTFYCRQGGVGATIFDAIEAFQLALEQMTRERVPLEWAMVQGNLANAYVLIESEFDDRYINYAIDACIASIREYENRKITYEAARTKNSLGMAYFSLGKRGKKEALWQAITTFEEALLIFTRERAPFLWASTKYNIGNIYKRIGENGDSVYFEQAIACYKDALGVVTHIRSPLHWGDLFRSLGDTLLLERDWRPVIQHLEPEVESLVEAVLLARTDADRNQLIEIMTGLADMLAYAWLKLGSPEKALRAALSGRGVFLEVAALVRLLDRGEGALADAYRAYREAAQSLDAIEEARSKALVADGGRISEAAVQERRERLERAYETYRREIDRVRRREGFQATPPTLADLRAHIPQGGALVVAIATEIGGALIVTGGSDATAPVASPDSAGDLRVVWLDGMTTQDLSRRAGEQLSGIATFGATLRGRDKSHKDLLNAVHMFNQSIEIALAPLGALIMQPLAEMLGAMGVPPAARDDVAAPEIIMMAPGRLACLPLAAAACDFGWFMDGYALSFVPSASALIAAATTRRARSGETPRVLCITNPGEDFADPETPGAIMRRSPALPVFAGDGAIVDLHRDASRERVLEELEQEPTHLVVYTHGHEDPHAPHRSFLQLARRPNSAKETDGSTDADDYDQLFPSDIRHLRCRAPRTVMLGACSSGRFGIVAAPDEYQGLIASFVEAGASSVCGSSWPVSARATAPYVRAVLSHEKNGLSMARSVRAANLSLRNGEFGSDFMSIDAISPGGDLAIAVGDAKKDQTLGPTRGNSGDPPKGTALTSLRADAPFIAAAFAAWGI